MKLNQSFRPDDIAYVINSSYSCRFNKGDKVLVCLNEDKDVFVAGYSSKIGRQTSCWMNQDDLEFYKGEADVDKLSNAISKLQTRTHTNPEHGVWTPFFSRRHPDISLRASSENMNARADDSDSTAAHTQEAD